ncbi:hypothetical protein ASPZODRAFT_660354 [Penicilliopsis zonata CBS 506.65]|uniref:Chitin-binding type-4 domain-containing protein n=1 Tax=Penicilliopsis zonata CBS 506.65 TaxID=1073090 RepID=A0A1L9SCN1_9EURO|nr:hypothetical protein ASPZODRAFT_660354 [Penicilliopsis zonata CBS 506.65]OJJ44975.1 hypothetical protein ASPZODRAFT_660354 [Penicilliopsis zonata CBS 506.65]
MKSFFIISGLLAASASAHMQMSSPYPIRSPLNKNNTGKVDYSYTNPLSTSGSDYPCKGYANDSFVSVADYTPGQTYQITLAGSATHGGGSCQISLSYDQGKTFKVIHSMLGGCPLQDSYDFQVPSDAPSGQALLAWTWFNKIGNREMYMNCAQVTVKGASSKRDHRRDIHSKLAPRAAFSNLPPIFLANVNQEGQCTTIEDYEVNFPLPGSSVEGSLNGTGFTCKSNAAFLGSGSISSGPSSSSSSSSSKSPSATNAALFHASSSSARIFQSSSSMRASSFGTVPTPSQSFPSSTPGFATSLPSNTPSADSQRTGSESNTGSCSSGSIICSPDGSTWSLCANGAAVPMGMVASGTHCRNGAMIPA